ncbi:hypothetical protein LGR54_23255 [Ancylobacter sp. Lp-2]|uniref:curli-like amyloid fiber formation chaperone CsgH n=1 Tax=Ancylobacter sp. Lp-2 TaxID=2881339 RepID=UPI001E4885B9|nr:curli-like amyloid fiber formation chaperone CsgH [Ancylobacter sp. Lp-2]MCB4771532.1 hypothetical protein [Ancylobacter sp. Lp-2]
MIVSAAAMPPCHIEVVERNGMVRLEAVLDSHDVAKGQYVLVVRSGTSDNVSTSRQGGEFEVGDLENGRLATAYVGAAGWSAQLKVYAHDGKLVCTSSKS